MRALRSAIFRSLQRAKASGAQVIIVNGDETAMDRYADWLLVGQIGEILPALVGLAD